MPVTHDPPAARRRSAYRHGSEEARNLGLDGMRQQRAARRRAKPRSADRQNVPGWASLKTLVSVTAYHSFRWRSGGVEHPHDTPPYPSRRHQLPRIAHSSFRWADNSNGQIVLTSAPRFFSALSKTTHSTMQISEPPSCPRCTSCSYTVGVLRSRKRNLKISPSR